MGLIATRFGDPFSPPGILDTPVVFDRPSLRNIPVTADTSVGGRGGINTGSGGLFSRFGDLLVDSFGTIAGAGVNRLSAEISGFTRDSIDAIERDSFGSLQNEDAAKKERQRARAVKVKDEQTASTGKLVGLVALIAAVVGGFLLLRRS